jgi:hypothetical protein
MAFVTEKEELKPGLILFRRGDVDHRMWYCRMKMPKADRYKTVSLKTSGKEAARERAFDQGADIRFRIKHDVPVFNRPFRDVAREYLLTQEARAKRGEISAARPKKLRAVIEGTLDRYAGSTQVHLIGDERWGGYAVTSHSSQGQTAERVLKHVDTELAAKDLLNSRMAYVDVSRGAEDAQLFTNDRAKLPEALGHDISHESAHITAMKPEQAITPPQQEIAPVIEHGYGMGHSL